MMKNKVKRPGLFNLLLVTTLGLFVNGFIQFSSQNPMYSGVDSYYHVTMAKLLMRQGVLHQFPWMQFTILKENFVNLHLGFHLFLCPWLVIFGEPLGPKIAVVVLGGMVTQISYLLLRSARLPWAGLIVIVTILLMPMDFWLRQNYIRNIALTLCFMLGSIYAIRKNQNITTLVVSSIFSINQAGFVYLGSFLCILLVAYGWHGIRPMPRTPLLAAVGILVGTVFSPYFPQNLEILRIQVFETGIGAESYVGNEWKPYPAWLYIQQLWPSLIVSLLGMICFAQRKRKKPVDLALVGFSLLFFVLSIKSRRFVEYMPWLSVLTGFIGMAPQLRLYRIRLNAKQNGRPFQIYGMSIALISVIAIALANGIGFSGKGAIYNGRATTITSYPIDTLTKLHKYLMAHSQPGDIVFHDDWTAFPGFFYVNQHNFFLAGLDPEFINQYSGEPYPGKPGMLYREYASISSGIDGSTLDRIPNDFRAKWVIVTPGHNRFYKNLKQREDLFEEVLRVTPEHPARTRDPFFLFRVKYEF